MMQYLLTQEEYDALKAVPRQEIRTMIKVMGEELASGLKKTDFRFVPTELGDRQTLQQIVQVFHDASSAAEARLLTNNNKPKPKNENHIPTH